MIADPVGSGFVASFPHPGGNATGFVVTEGSLGGKWLQLLKEIAPGIERVAMLYNPIAATYAQYWLNPFKAAAADIGVEASARQQGSIPASDCVQAPVRSRVRLRIGLFFKYVAL